MTACKWTSSTEPRVIPGRHEYGCESETCAGCQPCSERHCRVCGTAHSDGACEGCMAEVRENLGEIRRMCLSLPEEVAVRGVEGEAMNLLGPVADPEARGHLEASVLAGRVPPEYLEEVHDDLHPTFVTERWGSVYREAFDHDEPTGRVDLGDELGYLGRNLTYMATFEWVPFDEFAKDVRACVGHLERVLHDGEQIDRGAPCLNCKVPLERVFGATSDGDGWSCPRCRRASTDAQYRFAMKADYIQRAEWLTDVDMAVRVPTITAATVRSWASEKGDRPVLIRKTLHSQRIVYSVEDVLWIDACRKAARHAA